MNNENFVPKEVIEAKRNCFFIGKDKKFIRPQQPKIYAQIGKNKKIRVF